jgi:hypothetical protein
MSLEERCDRWQCVEEAFAAKLGVVSAQSAKADDAITALTDQSFAEKPTQIDKSVLGFPEPRRISVAKSIPRTYRAISSSSSAL